MHRAGKACACEGRVGLLCLLQRIEVHGDYGVDLWSVAVVSLNAVQVQLGQLACRNRPSGVGRMDAGDGGFLQMELLGHEASLMDRSLA